MVCVYRNLYSSGKEDSEWCCLYGVDFSSFAKSLNVTRSCHIIGWKIYELYEAGQYAELLVRIPFCTHTLLMSMSSLSAFTAGDFILKWNSCNDNAWKSSNGHCYVWFCCGQVNKESKILPGLLVTLFPGQRWQVYEGCSFMCKEDGWKSTSCIQQVVKFVTLFSRGVDCDRNLSFVR